MQHWAEKGKINSLALGEPMLLSEGAEEVATFYAKMLGHDYTQKEIFNKNFFEDWRKEMTSEERSKIKKIEKCDFKEMNAYFEKVRFFVTAFILIKHFDFHVIFSCRLSNF